LALTKSIEESRLESRVRAGKLRSLTGVSEVAQRMAGHWKRENDRRNDNISMGEEKRIGT
jgi:hypothetical protein